ncbi:MAG: hypothetical protein OMM_04375 [Candidatus Magnetoglobus multicellularis str. Araruama]|uniref:Sucrose phosphatase-like domain-containing protein n=1 Tax=Candidatus Magnetoglobus multicellularis str. Araruama TaxID=890399 RepID=A0A1V1P1S0_9BACT|nr:MAG: hypothetical protein OMM_04375 [Candidatus Magnetoglobus multicellularis str. Araruama]
MKKILYNEIDGFKIIVGEAALIVDPEATKKKVGNSIENTEEFKQQKKYADEMNNHWRMMAQSEESYKLAEKQNNKKKMQEHEDNYYYHRKKYKELEKQLHKLAPIINKKRSELFKENEVYFEPSKNEIHVEDAQCDRLINLFMKNSYVNTEGKIIPDNRGIYYSKDKEWSRHEITKIGVDPQIDWIKEKNLTSDSKEEIYEQFELERIANLSPEDKLKEAEQLKVKVTSESVYMKHELEIKEDPKATEKSRKYYKEECQKIDDLYGIK